MIASAILNYYIIEVDYGRLELEAFFGRPMSKYYNDDNWSWEAEQAKQRDARQAIIDSAKQGMTYDKPCAHSFTGAVRELDGMLSAVQTDFTIDIDTSSEEWLSSVAPRIRDDNGVVRIYFPETSHSPASEVLLDEVFQQEAQRLHTIRVLRDRPEKAYSVVARMDGSTGMYFVADSVATLKLLGTVVDERQKNKECPECKGDPQGVLLFSGYSPCSLCNSTND